MPEIPIPQEPVCLALIGAGNRSQTIYAPLFPALAPWARVTAVCDPVRAHADRLAAELGAAPYHDIRRLVKDRPMEAALVVTPVESHHSISVYLSTNGIHNHTETTWASMVCQARQMVQVAAEHRVVARVAENFFRFPIDRFSRVVRDSGYLGRIGRIFSYADHTGYHNNSRWIVFTRSHPTAVQCLDHTMAHPAFYSMPQRRHEAERLHARFYWFPGDFLVMDTGSGHVKGLLGRHPRPGYTEWHGERGTLVYRAPGVHWGGEQAELRRVSDERLAPAQEAAGRLEGGGQADQVTPVVLDMDEEEWYGSYADTPLGRIEYTNPLRLAGSRPAGVGPWYRTAVLGHLVDFALAVRGLRASEFTAEDALMSDMMEVGARESALQEGRRVALPLAGDLEADARERERQRQKLGVDPLDIEAMLDISYPRP